MIPIFDLHFSFQTGSKIVQVCFHAPNLLIQLHFRIRCCKKLHCWIHSSLLGRWLHGFSLACCSHGTCHKSSAAPSSSFSLASKYSLIVSPRVEFYLKVVALVRFASLFASCFRLLFRKLLALRCLPVMSVACVSISCLYCFCVLDYTLILLSVLAPQALLFP